MEGIICYRMSGIGVIELSNGSAITDLDELLLEEQLHQRWKLSSAIERHGDAAPDRLSHPGEIVGRWWQTSRMET